MYKKSYVMRKPISLGRVIMAIALLFNMAITGLMFYTMAYSLGYGGKVTVITNQYGEAIPELIILAIIMLLGVAGLVYVARGKHV